MKTQKTANGPNRSLDKSTLGTFFFPIEQAILATYLGRLADLPGEIQQLDARATVNPETWDESKQGIAPLEPCVCGDGGRELTLANAVARICLQNIQCDLPQWAGVDLEGRPTVARKITSNVKLPTRVLVSRHLFTINWSSSWPGFSWPQRYTATRVPGFNAIVVSASDDTPEIVGYCDYAIGFYPQGEHDRINAQKIVTAYWKKLVDHGDQTRFEEFFEAGFIDATTAAEWANEVWPQNLVERK
jgi:hypothetical protein